MSSDFWRSKPAADWDAYWATLHAPHRNAIVQALRTLPHFSSLLEVGCGPGVNLWRILEAFPDADLTGIDINAAATDNGLLRFGTPEAVPLFQGEGRVALCDGPLPEALSPQALPPLQPVDVVLSCYAVAYLPPERLHETLAGMVTLARQAVVLAEPMATPHAPPAKLTSLPEWRHDYLAWFREAAPTGWTVTTLRPLVVDRMNRLLVAQRTA